MKEKKEQYSRKPELRIVESLSKKNSKPDIEVFLAPFQVEYNSTNKTYKIIYPKHLLNKKKHRYKDYCFKNVGDSAINRLDICATFKNHNILVEYSFLDYIVNNNTVEYSFCYDRKIRKDDEIVIRVYFLENNQMCHPFSCTLAILYEDEFKNLWEQAFWYEKDNVYEPRTVTAKEYRSYITFEDALACIEQPWLW